MVISGEQGPSLAGPFGADGHRHPPRKCKINANIGNSAVTQQRSGGARQAAHGRNITAAPTTVMDLSTGKDIDRIRAAIIEASPVPIGTVPHLSDAGGARAAISRTCRPQHFLDMVEHQAKQGVDYMTVHCGVMLEHLPLTMGRVTPASSVAGGSLIAKWMMTHRQQNPLYNTHF